METTFVREVTLRYRGKKRAGIAIINGPGAVFGFMCGILPDNVREHFLVLYLNGAHCVVGYSVVASGSANACGVCPREVFQAAVLCGACAIVCGHNHPSGSVTPSESDFSITRRLKEAGEVLGIKLLDHVIIGDGVFYSFNDSMAL